MRECRVLDVSQYGAKIVIDVGDEIGTRFGLALVPNRPRQCEIVWRRGGTLGIKFVPSRGGYCKSAGLRTETKHVSD